MHVAPLQESSASVMPPIRSMPTPRMASSHGLYNESPTWWKQTYFPAKSGVGGVIMIVIPGVMGIGIVSPPLNKYGNSYKGVETGKLLANIQIY